MSLSAKPKAVIFDWDDTLVDTGAVVRNAINVALVAMGCEPWSEEEAQRHMGPPARVLFTGLFGEDRWQEADKIYIKAYEDGIIAGLRKHEHVNEIIDALEKSGITLVVVSAKRGYLLRKEAEILGLDKHFLKMVGAGDAANDKPHIDAVLMALSGSGIAPGQDVWFLGDSHTDLIAAKNANCTGVLIETKLPPQEKIDQYSPDLRFKTHADLLVYVQKWLPPSNDLANRPAPKI